MDHVPRMSGAEQSLADLVVGVSRGPVEPVVMLPADGPLATELRANGVLVRIVPMNKRMLETSREKLGRSPFTALARLFAFLIAGWRTFRVLRDVRPDVVHTNTLKSHLIAVLPCLAARVPLIWHVRDILPKGWVRSALVSAARFASVVIVPSRAVAEGFRGHKRVYRKLRLIPNGINIREFVEASKDRSLREMIGAKANDPVIGLVGRIAPWKGQDVFLRAASMLAQRFPKAHFVVIGAPLFQQDVAYEQALHRMVADLGIAERVSFLGWQPAPEAMAAIDIFVHGSSQPEPFGRAIVEAMAAGKPVVAAAGGAVPEIVPPAAGFLVPPGRPELLADALDRLLEDKALRKRMGQAGAEIAASFFPVERTITSVAGLYRTLAVRAARRRRRAQKRMPKRMRRREREQAQQRPPQERPMVWPRPDGSHDQIELDDAPRVRRGRPQPPLHPDPPAADPAASFEIPDYEVIEVHDEPEIDEPEIEVHEPDVEEFDEVAIADDDDDDIDEIDDVPTRSVGRVQPRAPRPGGSAVAVAERRPVAVAMERPVPVAQTQVFPTPAPVQAPPVEITSPVPVVTPRPAYDAIKRVLDIFISLSVLVVGLPLWILIAVLIKLESPGPVLHRGTVVGKGCRAFTYFKFRSMRIDGDDANHRRFIERYVRENGGHEEEGEVIYKLLGDDRVTSIGRFIRKLSLDEIPQLLNVLRGEMSIVGPRPPLDYEFELYDETAKRRLQVLPGITGMQQVWHRHTASFEEKLGLDFKYIAERGVWLDIKLILHSFRAVFRGH